MKKILLFFIVILSFGTANARLVQDEGILKDFKGEYYRDDTHKVTLNEVLGKKFKLAKSSIFNFSLDTATYWIKLSSKEAKDFHNDILFIDQSRLSLAVMYIYGDSGKIQLIKPYITYPYGNNNFSQGKIFKLPPVLQATDTIFLKLRSNETFLAPVSIISEGSLLENFSLRGIIFGFYTGIMLIMFVYNLFLFIIIRDKSYLFYIF
jgi:two-component system NtrC family sensor kinase